MLETNSLLEMFRERMGNSRNLSDSLLKNALIFSANDLISEFKQNVLIHEVNTNDSNKVITIKNIAHVFKASFNDCEIPITRLASSLNDKTLKLIILDTQSVRLEPHTSGKLEILGSFYIDNGADIIPLSHLFQRAILQNATLNLFIMLDKPIEHIKNAKALVVDLKDELRTQINRAQEKQSLLTKNIRL